jgi:hypothetical protein
MNWTLELLFEGELLPVKIGELSADEGCIFSM